MHTPSPLDYRRSTEMAAEDMISEGSPLRQPSKAETEAALARNARHSFSHRWAQRLQHMMTPTTTFWTGFATGLAVSLLDRKLRRTHLPTV